MQSAERTHSDHKKATWNHIQADLVRRTGLARKETNVASEHHSLFLNIKGAARFGQNYLDGKRVPFAQRPEGSLVYIPAGCSWNGWDEGDQIGSYLRISVEHALVEGLFESQVDVRTLPPNLSFKNVAVQFAAQKIALEMMSNDASSRFMVEAYVVEIFVNLLRRWRSAQETLRGGLSPAALKRVIEMIEALFDQSIKLKDLAEQAGMSVYHFSRSFKHSTGSTPHSYVNRRRLERASDLLRSSDMSITQIGIDSGFSSSSHFSTAFTQTFGISPVSYRALWAGKL